MRETLNASVSRGELAAKTKLVTGSVPARAPSYALEMAGVSLLCHGPKERWA